MNNIEHIVLNRTETLERESGVRPLGSLCLFLAITVLLAIGCKNTPWPSQSIQEQIDFAYMDTLRHNPETFSESRLPTLGEYRYLAYAYELNLGFRGVDYRTVGRENPSFQETTARLILNEIRQHLSLFVTSVEGLVTAEGPDENLKLRVRIDRNTGDHLLIILRESATPATVNLRFSRSFPSSRYAIADYEQGFSGASYLTWSREEAIKEYQIKELSLSPYSVTLIRCPARRVQTQFSTAAAKGLLVKSNTR